MTMPLVELMFTFVGIATMSVLAVSYFLSFARWLCRSKQPKRDYMWVSYDLAKRLLTTLGISPSKVFSLQIKTAVDKPFTVEVKRYCERETEEYIDAKKYDLIARDISSFTSGEWAEFSLRLVDVRTEEYTLAPRGVSSKEKA